MTTFARRFGNFDFWAQNGNINQEKSGKIGKNREKSGKVREKSGKIRKNLDSFLQRDATLVSFITQKYDNYAYVKIGNMNY